jgi:hypothetical protein
MIQIPVRYEDGEFHLPKGVSPETLKDSRVKVVVTVAKGEHQRLSREAHEQLRDSLMVSQPAELRIKIERETAPEEVALPVSEAHSAEAKLRAYWDMKGLPPAEQRDRLLGKLAQLETRLFGEKPTH